MTLLSVNNLVVKHGLLSAVRNVCLDIGKGETLALVGANGAGKTTLLRSLAGAHAPAAGEIRLNGQDITAVPSHKRIGMVMALVPEGRRLFQQMTVEENLLLGGVSGRPGDWNIDRVLETFPNLKTRLKSRGGHLSGGEQQATAIGRALMSNPDILLLDEVSLGLSPMVVDRVYKSLQALLESGTTIILVEQDLSRAMAHAGRIVCMLEGQVVLDRPTAAVSRADVTAAYFGLHASARAERNPS
jgi:branched-chain amino acid transport system ATP-binding protein